MKRLAIYTSHLAICVLLIVAYERSLPSKDELIQPWAGAYDIVHLTGGAVVTGSFTNFTIFSCHAGTNLVIDSVSTASWKIRKCGSSPAHLTVSNAVFRLTNATYAVSVGDGDQAALRVRLNQIRIKGPGYESTSSYASP